MKRKTKTYRKKLALLTNAQHRQSVQLSFFWKGCSPLAFQVLLYNGWWA